MFGEVESTKPFEKFIDLNKKRIIQLTSGDQNMSSKAFPVDFNLPSLSYEMTSEKFIFIGREYKQEIWDFIIFMDKESGVI